LGDARVQNEQFKADRSNFWKVVARTTPSKLYLFSESELRDCQEYFLTAQSDPAVPPTELIMAAERLTLIRSEIDVRHGNHNYRRVQRLAWWAIGLAVISLAGAIAFGVTQFLTKQEARGNWSADTVSSDGRGATNIHAGNYSATELHTRGDSPACVGDRGTDEHTNSDEAISRKTPEQTSKHSKGTLRRAGRSFFRSLFEPRPTQTPSAVLRR
jgi:hypothetical protein